MNFKTNIYIGLKNKYPRNKIAYGSQITAIIIMFLLLKKTIINNPFWTILICILLFFPIFIKIFNFWQQEIYTYDEEILLEIDEEKIIIGEKMYYWKEIKNIKIDYHDYKGRQEYRGSGNYRPNKSAGFENYISFLTIDNEQVKYNFKLDSAIQIYTLRCVFERMAKQKTLTFDVIKKLYKPENYADTQKIKSLYEAIS